MPYHKYEIARIIGARAFQLALNSPSGIEPKEEKKSYRAVIDLAYREFVEGKYPVRVKKKQ